MTLFEPCLWHQLLSAHFQDAFVKCKEILYSEIKWLDVLHPRVKHSFSTELTKSYAVWWIAMIHEMWHVSSAITLEILGLLVWNKRKEYKSIYCRVFQQKVSRAFPHVLFLHKRHFLSQKLSCLGLHSVPKICVEISLHWSNPAAEEEQVKKNREKQQWSGNFAEWKLLICSRSIIKASGMGMLQSRLLKAGQCPGSLYLSLSDPFRFLPLKGRFSKWHF